MFLTLRLCVLYGSHSRQRLLPYTILADWFYITKVESVYSAVQAESFYATDTFIVVSDQQMRQVVSGFY
jgi:hypothetical protein